MSGAVDIPGDAPDVLARAFDNFASCSNRLQESFAALQEEVRSLAAELEAKNEVIEALERQAARNERISAMGEMAQRIAHQIRNPLGSIDLYASILVKDLPDRKMRELAERIAVAVRRSDLVVQNLLTFADDIDPVLVPLDVLGALEETLEEARQLLHGRGVTLEVEALADDVTVRADRDLLRQAILNLLTNAAQAVKEGDTVRFVTRNRSIETNAPPWLSMEVVDEGVGIAPSDLERVFDPLYSTRRGAAGLGLAIVQRVAEAHGGVIEVESEPGRGSTFRLSFPVAA
jgi:signal transduction histidine kinase